MKREDRAVKLKEDYKKTKGWEIHWRLEHLNYYKSFFDSNYIDLLKKIYEYKENLSYFWGLKIDGTRNLDNFMIEFARYLHNYLMSLSSLKNKTSGLRNHLNKNFGLKISDDNYNKKLEEYKIKEFYDFLIELRHAFTHKIKNEGFLQLLFNYDPKNKIGKVLVGEKELENLIKDYKSSTDKFIKWFFNQIQTNFSAEIKQTNLLIEKYNQEFGISLDQTTSNKEFNCLECKKQFTSNNPLGILDDNDNVLGFICEECKKIHNDIITQKLKCSKCENLLKNMKFDVYQTIYRGNIIAEIFYKCNDCGYEGNISLKTGKKEFRFRK